MISRLMNEEDIPEIGIIEKLCFSSPWSEAEIRATFFREDSIYIVVEKDGAVIGYAAFFFVLDEGNIINVGVKPEYRNQKAGEHLMELMIEEARQKEIRKLFLEVRESNRSAIGLYKKFGFKEEGVRKNFYTGPEENGIVMVSTIC